MKINLITDAPKHNLALMKISAWHKAKTGNRGGTLAIISELGNQKGGRHGKEKRSRYRFYLKTGGK